MKIWTTEHVFNHSWETVATSQWQKYPNPHNTAVLGTDVLERSVDKNGVLHSHRIITSDWGLAQWVQNLIGANRECYAHEYSTVDPKQRHMELHSVNLTFCSFVSMRERMSYVPHPEDPENKTILKQETIVTVQGVPLTSYMESLIVNTVSNNSSKGRNAIEHVVEKLSQEGNQLSKRLEKLSLEIQDLKHTVGDSIVATAKKSIEELQLLHIPRVAAEQSSIAGPATNLGK